MNLERDLRPYDVLIVGAGHAGAQTAIGLRKAGFSGSISIIGDEPDPPYERPPLSKDYLGGDKGFERILIRPESFWAENEVSLHLGMTVESVDPVAHTVLARDGSVLGYGRLVWAAGGKARRLSCEGANLAGVHVVRSRADVDLLLRDLKTADSVVVVGGGFIGLETAATIRKSGKAVTVVEAQPRLLARVAGPEISDFFAEEHRNQGVRILLGTAIQRLEAIDGRVSAVVLTDEERLPADVVIVGIGIIPSSEPLVMAGARGGNGIWVDGSGRTSLSDIFAVGDCALHGSGIAQGAEIRLESVQNAADMAGVVVKTLMGETASYDAVPWFWSNQYELKLQTVGLASGYDETVVRGHPSEGGFSVIYLRAGQVIALDCVNAVRDYVQGRALVASQMCVSRDLLADVSIPLKSHAITQGG